jgi:predicted metalloprotease with PDZ domain
MSDFFHRYISGREPLPYEQYFAYAGLRVVRESQASKPWSGITAVKGDDGRPVISGIVPESPAEQAGLDRGDILEGVNGKEVTLENFPAALGALRPGDVMRLTVVREKELRDFSVTMAPNPYAAIRIVPVEKPTELQKKIYESWIGHPWPQKK